MRLLTSLTTLALLAGMAAPAYADGFIVIEPRPPERPNIRNVPLAVKNHRVTVKVKGRIAITDIDQVFVNHNPRRVEGTYLFPLPVGAAIDEFEMWVNGEPLSAELLDASKARKIYEDIVRQQLDPALLEYAEQSLFKARIFPIEPNSEKRVRIRYAEVLSADNGTVAYRYPLNTEKFSSRPLEHVSIDVSIDDDLPITSIFSPSHDVDVPSELGKSVRLGWEARDVTPDRDFLLYWRPTKKDVGVSVIAHRKGEDGTFMLVLSPNADEEAAEIPKDIVFVMDTSGSMAGQKMEQARGALRFCLRSLGENDRFAIVPFATEPRPFRDALVKASAENRKSAEEFVDGLKARGGTAIDDALGMALGMLSKAKTDERPTMVLFVTDGLPTIGRTDADTIVDRAKGVLAGARMFVFGVGNDVNTRMLDRLARENRGTRDYVTENESIEEKVSNLYSKLARPAMTDLELKIEGVAASAVHPRALGDLFHGSEILVVGRYDTAGNAVIRLKGKVRGKERTVVEEVKFPGEEAKHEFLPRLWGVRRVAFLLEEIRIHGESAELRDEVVRLARKYGIVTPYTSYLILEDEARGGPISGGGRTRPGLRSTDWGGTGGGGASGPATGGADAPAAPAATEEELDEARRVRRSADDAADGETAEAGEKAVELSRELKDLDGFRGARDQGRVLDSRSGGKNSLVRHVNGRTFVRRGGVWWDLDLDLDKDRELVQAFGERYFALVADAPELGKFLTLGDVALEVDGVVYVIRREL